MSSSGLRKQHNRQMKYLLEGTVHMSSSGLREQHNRQLNICWREQYIICLLCCFLNPDEDICTVPSNRYFICLLCCFFNPDEDICTVPLKYLLQGIIHISSSGMIKRHNRQLKYPLEGTVHMSSSGLRKQHNRQSNICWREQYICLHRLFCCSLNPDEDICTVPSNRYSIVYNVVFSSQMKTYVLFLPTDIQFSIVLLSGLRKHYNRQ
jgi:hypothetical protein